MLCNNMCDCVLTVDGGTNRSQHMKYYRALYDYNPLMMSPNEGLEEEELCFHEGDIIKVCIKMQLCLVIVLVNLH